MGALLEGGLIKAVETQYASRNRRSIRGLLMQMPRLMGRAEVSLSMGFLPPDAQRMAEHLATRAPAAALPRPRTTVERPRTPMRRRLHCFNVPGRSAKQRRVAGTSQFLAI